MISEGPVSHNRNKRHRRGGKAKLTCLFWNAHGRSSVSDKVATDNFLNRFSIPFLCETWITNPSSILPNKDLFISEAHKPKIGRPSGGIDINTNPNLRISLIYKSQHNINVLIRNIHFIGGYYKPSTELEDLLSDIQVALNKCSSPFIILCGDINNGCAGQYKNHKNLFNLCPHKQDVDINAEWSLFATSHGKSPCDGIGGDVKRVTANASLQRPLNLK
ncbi:hypothetical protein GQR58_011837 [Nymphon striatum]|nr:hypothetical protein GQR58_011837 [Nymphon striatum]